MTQFTIFLFSFTLSSDPSAQSASSDLSAQSDLSAPSEPPNP